MISVALVSATTASGLIAFPPIATAAVSATSATDPVADGSKSEEDYALEQAAATGQPYELTYARTESTDTWALPNGTWSVKRHGTPVRLLRDGAWVPTDADLVFATGGSVTPKASTVDVTFSGGGTGPLLTGVKDGRTLSLTWPKPLPTPTLEENVATYAEVLPGVDLQLKAEIEGFSQLLVVKTAAAADNPELATLKYKLGTVGLAVSTDPDTGSLSATNPAGQTVFTSPSPLMWDSTTISSSTAPAARSATTGTAEDEAPAEVFDPPPGAQDAQMPTTVTGDTLEIKPDQDLLTGENTTYPVFIDPSFAFGEKQNWTRVYKAYPNTSFWNTKDPVRVGYEAETGGSNRISRSFVQLDTTDVKGAQVKSSVFRIRNTWSWSCQSRPVELWHTTGISKKTTWNNQPSKKTKLDTVDDAKGWNPKIEGCAAGNLEFDTTAKIRDAANNGWSSITLGLYASNETDTFGWKKFDAKTSVLETVYNNPPKAPKNPGTSPRTDCKAGGLIGNARVSLYAEFDDKDAGNLTAEFELFKSGDTSPSAKQSVPAIKGKVSTWAVPDASLPSGNWTWRARTKDQDNATSGWSTTCKFTIDRTRPSKPPLITSADNKFPPGDNGWPAVTGKARSTGTFTFTPNGVTDVANYVSWTDYEPEPTETVPGVPVSVRPPGYGPHFVYAYSVDKAGNRSDTATYVYYAGRSVMRDGPTDLNGDTLSDIWNIDSNGTLLTYAGQDDGHFAAATNGGGSFTGADVESRGDWGQDGYNDLVALQYDDIQKQKRLWTYKNNGSGVITDNRTELTVSCPTNNPDLGCIGDDPAWTGDDHWHNAEQIIAPGDINGDTSPDLLVKQGKFLWAYYGNRAGSDLDLAGTRQPVLVGGNDWDKFTVIAPGDLNGDTIADLWLRNDTTGDIWRSYGKKGSNGYLDPTTWGNTSARVKIGSGYQAATYPAIGSVGDVTGDNLADLWARKTDNTMIGWPGKVPGTDNKSFGTSFVIDGVVGGARIPSGTTLTSGQSHTSRSAKLTMQNDGNLVITSKANKSLWSSKTAGNAGATARVETNGNLSVYSVDGSTKLWSTNLTQANTPDLLGEGYALLQDSGDLVVYNVKGQSLWSSGTTIRHDFNGDGRSDFGTWYDHTDGSDAAWSFLTNSDGTFNTPIKSPMAASGNWDVTRSKFATGDFNGDGLGDLAALYSYDNNGASLWTALGKSGGGFNPPTRSWYRAANSFGLASSTIEAGDFNGDGRDDIALWYRYADGSDKLRTFTSTVTGGFNEPFISWESTGGAWERNQSRLVTGDFNGDGREDLGALYGYSDSTAKIWVFATNPAGGFTAPTIWWESTSFDWIRSQAHAGDFNGDGRDDIAMWYVYPDNTDKVHITTAVSTPTDAFGSSREALTVTGGWDLEKSRLLVGDYNGDGLDDLAAMYNYPADNSVKMWTWTMKPDGTFNPAVSSWSATANDWSFTRTRFLSSYNS
ncbi:FG-GAP-like repeat-containing protein [Streptomyces sp. NPDC057445]|uniref:FG-GAP-like repeat-containing protein n=1 Tax=Streptomyces sp. NPDC057445 TaxID=3346136 RepID=UPI0036C17B2E